MTRKALVLTSSEMRQRLLENSEDGDSSVHVIGSARHIAQSALDDGIIPDGASVSFHDEDDSDAYCLAVVRGKSLMVLFKTYEKYSKGQ